MNKPNDFLAAQLQAPDDFTLADFYAYGITPDNTVLYDKDYYKNIPKVIDTFTKDGKFDENAFNSFYDSALRSYNDWSTTDFASRLIENYAKSPEDIYLHHRKNSVRDTDAKLFITKDPWRHQVGFGNIYEVGKESYDIREVAQANNARDAEGNVLSWTPNDKGGLFKGLFRNPMALATDENGAPILDDNGDPFYRELADGESVYGKEMLHYSDTLTAEDTWLNKIDFFDNDGLDKSVTGTIARTVVKLAPYFLPGVGEILGAIGAVYGLARSLPVLAKSINGIITNGSDESDFGKTMNNLEAFWSKFDTTKSRYSMEHQWSLENIGDMVVSSAKQLFEQRTFTRIPEWLKLNPSKFNQGFFGTMSLGYMALTSSEDSLETFKNAGMSDTSAGIASLAYTAAMFGLMNNDYFKSWLFRNSWVNGTPEITQALKENSKASAKVAQESVMNAVKGNKKLLVLPKTAPEKDAQKLFKTVYNATKEAWAKKSIDPLKGLDVALPGAVNAGNVYLHHALNEGIEEVMEETALDGIKLMALGLERLGFDLTDETKENLDFGLTWNDAFQRYSTAFWGGAIGGAVFQGMDDWHSKVLNKDMSKLAGRGVNGELFRAIRLYGKERVAHELTRLYKKGLLGDNNLKLSGKWTEDPVNEGKRIWVWDSAKEGDKTQNDAVYGAMLTRINTIAAVMADKNFNLDDNTILKDIAQGIKKEAEKEGISEEEYAKKHHIQLFDEFAKKTGFADIVLTDIGNLMLDVIQLNDAIEARKADIANQYPGDVNSTEREDAIKKDKVIKDLEKEQKDVEQQIEDIKAGKAASYYVRYASFAAHSTTVANLLSANGDAVLDKEAFAYWKYRTPYTDAGEDLQKVIDEDYTDYIKLKGIGALEAANALYQRAVDLVAPLIANQQKDLIPSPMQSTVIGNLVEDLDTADTSTLLDRDGILNIESLLKQIKEGEPNEENTDDAIKKNLIILHRFVEDKLNSPINTNGQPYTDAQKYNDILNVVFNTYKKIKETNTIGHGADDWVRYAFKLIGNHLLENSSKIKKAIDSIRESSLAYIRAKSLENEEEMNNVEVAQIFENDPDDELRRLAELLKTLPEDNDADPDDDISVREKIFDRVDELKRGFIQTPTDEGNRGNAILDTNMSFYGNAKTLYDNIASEIATNPEKALEDILGLITVLQEQGISDDTTEDVFAAFNIEGLKNIANGIKEAVDLSKTLTKSPALDIAKAIAFDLSGEQNTILDLIENQRGELSTKVRASEYLMDPEIGRHLAIAKRVLPIVQSVLWASVNGINEEANKMMGEEGKSGELPTIDNNLWYIYKNDLAFIQNQIDFLDYLNTTNLGAKTREQVLVRNNFCGHIVDFINQQNPDGSPIQAVVDLQKALGNFDLVEAATRLGLASIDYSDQSKDNQVKIQKAFQDLEHEIYEHVKKNTDSINKVARNIMNVFPDAWQMKNGILSRKYDDQLGNFDIATYFLGVIGYDSYEFARKLKPIFESDQKFPFFGQELAIRLAVAGIANPELINGAIDGVYDTLEWAIDNGKIEHDPNSKTDEAREKDLKYLKDKTKLYNTIIIDGFAGTGKSTVVLKTALSFFDDVEAVAISKIADRATAVGLGADHTFDLKAALDTALGKDYSDKEYLTGNKENLHSHVWKDKNQKLNLLQLFKDKDRQHVLVIDECTLIKEGVWEAFTTAAREQNITIIGLGNSMQTGEINEKTHISAGLDDCIGLFSTKLTVSMRDGNFAKASNNDIVGRIVAKLIDAKKTRPNWGENEIVDQNPTGKIILRYGYNRNNKLFGDRIVSEIIPEVIDGLVSTMAPEETLTIVTPDNTLNALREKYKDNDKILFTSVDNVQGSESDYVVLNHNFNDSADAKFSTLQQFYTLLTRAKKGTIIKNSKGLEETLLVSDEQDNTAAVSTSFNASDAVTLEYKDTRLRAINAVPEKAPEEAPKEEGEEDDGEGKGGKEVSAGSEQAPVKNPLLKSPEEVISEIDTEINNSDPADDSATKITNQGVSGDEQLGKGLKGERLKAYKRYKYLKSSGDAAIIDIDYFADFVDSATVGDFGLFSGLVSNLNDEDIAEYKKLLKGVSSILLNQSDGKSLSGKLLERASNIGLDRVRDFNPEFVEKLRASLDNDNKIFFKKEYKDKMMLYYIFDNYAIPIAIYDPGSTEEELEGFVSMSFKQETPIIPITSQGQSRDGVTATLPKSIYVAEHGGTPVTAIFLKPEGEIDNNFAQTRYFLNNVGKAFALLVHEFGMTSQEIEDLFTPEKDGEVFTYFMKNVMNMYALAGVQQDINADDFINILSDVSVLLNGSNVNSQSNIERIARIAKFFGKTTEDVKTDFTWVSDLNKGSNIKENAERFRNIRRNYGLLYTREVNSFITALFAHFINQDDDNQWAQFSENIITKFIDVYKNNTTGDLRRRGFKFSIRNNGILYNWFIVPVKSSKGYTFNVYFANDNDSLDDATKFVATFNYDDIVKSGNKKYRFDLQSIITTLYNNSDIQIQMKSIDPNFSPDNWTDYLKADNIQFSLTTGIEADNRIDFWPPFESQILDLIDKTNIDKNALNDFIKASTIFKYGLYRQIKTAKNIDIVKDVWAFGDVPFDQLSWDIVKVLAPLYSINTERLNDEDYARMQKTFGKLYTPKVSNTGNISLETSGNTVLFKEGKDYRVIQDNQKIKDFLTNNGYTVGQDFTLERIRIIDNGIVFVLKYGPGFVEHTVENISDVNSVLHDLFDGYVNNDKINYSELVNETVEEDYDGIQLVLVNNRYRQIKVDGKRYNYKVLGKVSSGDKTYAYISSKAFVNNIRRIEVKNDTKLIDTNTPELIAVIPYDDTNNILYVLNNNTITHIEEGNTFEFVPKEITENGIIVNLPNGTEDTLDFLEMIPEQVERIKRIFSTETIKFGNNVKVLKKKGLWRFLGNVSASRSILRNISEYDGIDAGIVSKINFDKNTITINNVDYNLLVNRDSVEKVFELIPEQKNVEIIFRDLLKPYSKKLSDLNTILKALNMADDPTLVINSYLAKNVDNLQMNIEIRTTPSGDFEFVQLNPIKDAIAQKVLSNTQDLKYSDLNIIVEDNDSINKNFTITINGEEYLQGTISFEDNHWNVELFNPKEKSVDINYFKNNIAQLYQEMGDTLDLQAEAYLNLFNAEISGKDVKKFTPLELKYITQILTIAKNLTEEPKTLLEKVAKLYSEWTNYKQNCKTKF